MLSNLDFTQIGTTLHSMADNVYASLPQVDTGNLPFLQLDKIYSAGIIPPSKVSIYNNVFKKSYTKEECKAQKDKADYEISVWGEHPPWPREADHQEAIYWKKQMFKTPCQIYEEAQNRDACVKYEGEPDMQKFWRLMHLIDVRNPFKAPEIDGFGEFGISGGFYMAGMAAQVTFGDCSVEAYPIWQVLNRAVWEAWNKLKGKGISRTDAYK